MRPLLRSICAGAILGLSVLPASAAQPEEVPLPSAAAILRARMRAESLLRNGRGPEKTLPGRVADAEKVLVGLDLDGEPIAVEVRQRLFVRGVGDIFVKIPGPVRDVEGLAGSTALPGLRNGSIVWQGFSQGDEVLGARATLDATHEAERLPIDVAIDATLDGEPLESLHDLTGHLELDIRIENATGTSMTLPAGRTGAPQLAKALDAVRAQLARGERPVPGRNGVPSAVTFVGAPREIEREVSAPLRVLFELSLPKDARVDARHAFVTRRGGETIVQIEELLGDSDPSLSTHLEAELDGGAAGIAVRIEPAPPPVGDATPPDRRSWQENARRGDVDATSMVETLFEVAAQAARLVDVDGYLGNPDLRGPTRTSYLFVVEEPRAAVADGPRDRPEALEAQPLAVIVALLGAVAVVGGGVVWWSLS